MYSIMCVCVVYSEISDSGRSEIRTISLQRTQLEVPRYFLPDVPIHFGLPHKGQPPYKGQNDGPKVSFIWRFHCISKTRHLYVYSAIWLIYCRVLWPCSCSHTWNERPLYTQFSWSFWGWHAQPAWKSHYAYDWQCANFTKLSNTLIQRSCKLRMQTEENSTQ